MKAYTIRIELTTTIEAEEEECATDMAWSLVEWPSDPSTSVDFVKVEYVEDIDEDDEDDDEDDDFDDDLYDF